MTDSDKKQRVEYMVTTVDNPWNPFTHFKEWYQFDAVAGYNTPAYLARVVVTSDELSLADQLLAVNSACEEIVRENVSGMYRLVSRELPEQPSTVV